MSSVIYFARKYFAEPEKPVTATEALAATAAIFSENKKKVIYDIVLNLNKYFQERNMRERFILLSSYLSWPSKESHLSAVHIFVNILNGILSYLGSSYVAKLYHFDKEMQINNKPDYFSLSGPIFRSKYMDNDWILTTILDKKKNLTAITLTCGEHLYTFQVNQQQADTSPVVFAYREFFNFAKDIVFKEDNITDEDVKASGVKL